MDGHQYDANDASVLWINDGRGHGGVAYDAVINSPVQVQYSNHRWSVRYLRTGGLHMFTQCCPHALFMHHSCTHDARRGRKRREDGRACK